MKQAVLVQYCIVALLSWAKGTSTIDICLRFPHMTACAMLNKEKYGLNPPAPPVPPSQRYCQLGCSEAGSEVFNAACDCGSFHHTENTTRNTPSLTIITTESPATTAKLETTKTITKQDSTTDTTTTEHTTTESTTKDIAESETVTTEPTTTAATTTEPTTEITTPEPSTTTEITTTESTTQTSTTKPTTTKTTTTETTTAPSSTATTSTETTTATTQPTTTAEPLGHCVYTLNRAPQFKTVSKRLFEGTPVAVNCQYPGVVGVFRNGHANCMGAILDEDTILIDSYCAEFSRSFHMKILVNSYNTADIANSTDELDASTIKNLDSAPPMLSSLKTVKLTSPLTFDRTCVQPACFPNSKIRADDIDFDDCRFLGYGDTRKPTGPDPENVPRLMQVDVTVDRASIHYNQLKVQRKVGPPKTGPCFNDFGAPVICSNLQTKEWITVGIATGVAMPCESGSSWSFTVENLLREAVNPDFYNSLQSFKYTSRH